jgi:hypothetical protein
MALSARRGRDLRGNTPPSRDAASIASTLGVGDLDFWWELAGLIVVMLLGHWLEMRAMRVVDGGTALVTVADGEATLDESTIIVAANAKLLRRLDLRPHDRDALDRSSYTTPTPSDVSSVSTR